MPRRDSTPTLQSVLNDNLPIIADYRNPGAVVKVKAEGEASKALAWYTPDTSDITMDIEQYLVARPSETAEELLRQLERHTSGWRERFVPKCVLEIRGLLAHEAAHSRWSNWSSQANGAGLTQRIVNVMMLMEEARVEKRAVDFTRDPLKVRRALRASATLVLESLAGEYPNVAALANAWALINGRYRSGILTMAEFGTIDNAARTIVGDDILDQLVDLMDEAMAIDTRVDFARFVEIAEAWVEIVKSDDDSEEDGSENIPPSCEQPPSEDDEEGEGSGAEGSSDETSETDPEEFDDGGGDESTSSDSDEEDGEEDGSDSGSSIGSDEEDSEKGKSAKDTNETDSEDAAGEASDDTPNIDGDDLMKEAMEELVKKSQESAWTDEIIETYSPAVGAKETFGKRQSYKNSNWHIRKPTAEEINASNRLATHLENLAIPTIAQAKYNTATPTGRLRSREALRASADRAQGRMTAARPWTGRKRSHTTSAPVTIGIATDTSGSMRWAEQMVASAAFVVGRAGSRINARTAAVTFGSYVEAILSPEEQPTEVRQRAANGGVELFDRAIGALDGVLNLTTTDGVKILVIISDNHLVNQGEPERRALWLKKLKAAGVVTIWVDRNQISVPDSEVAVIDTRDDSMAVVRVITKAIDAAFKKQTVR